MMLWMEYSLLVAVLLTLAAHGAERVVRLNGRATRWVWLGALLLSFALPAVLPWLVRALASDGAGLLIPSTTLTLTLPPVVTSASPVISWTRVVQVVWVAASALLLLYGLWSLWSLHRSRRGWEHAVVLQHDVLLSSDVGPAVVGVLEPVIVLPKWVRTLSDSEQALILAHESAHIAAGDPLLMRVAQIAPVLMPWNIPLWLQARRLRECVELDCDARLLAAGENADGYAELLLNVGQRTTRVVLAAAMAEPRSLLERRIMRMFEKKPRKALLRASAWSAVALIAFFAAFNAPLPARAALRKETSRAKEKQTVGLPVLLKHKQESLTVQSAQQPASAQVTQNPRALPLQQSQQQEPQPTFTPFTVAPTLKNAADVVAALKANYPPLLRDADIGGSVKMWVHIDEKGDVIHLRIKTGSGYPALDQAALKVAETMKFTSALNRDQKVAVWVDMPIVFRPGKSDEESQLTPEQKAELRELRRSGNRQMSEQAQTDQALARQSYAVTVRQGDSVVTASSRVRDPKAAVPSLLNAEEVSRGLQRYYPPLLRDAGIGGEVLIWFYVNEQGVVDKVALKQSSGHTALDDAAMRVATIMRFAPAIKDGRPISAWIDLPIVFRTQ